MGGGIIVRGGFKNDFLVRQVWIKTKICSVFERFTTIGQDFGKSQAVGGVV